MYIYGAYPKCGSLFKDKNKVFTNQIGGKKTK